MNKFGPHFQRFTDEMANLIAEWQPPLAVWVDPDQAGVDEIRRLSPGTFIVGRKNEDGFDWRPNAAQRFAARLGLAAVFTEWHYQTTPEWWADECAAMARCDAYLYNEPIGHDERHLFAAFDEWQMRFRARLLEHGMEAIGLNVATGNFTKLDDIAACFPNTCATFRHIAIHEYDWPLPDRWPVDTERLGYYWDRWPYWLEYIGRDDVTLWVTECGWTQAVHEGRPDEGWRDDEQGIPDDIYIKWADWYNSRLVQDKRVGGAALFNFAGWGWPTFEHLGWERLGEILALDAEPSEGNGGNDMDIKIYDFDNAPPDGATVDWDWLRGVFGDVRVRAIEDKVSLREGDLIYKLVYLDARVGDANIIINVRDEDGQPALGETVIFGWPDAPPHGYADKPSNWTENGVTGDTNADGDVGPGLGDGAYYDPKTERGPHFIWVWDLPSDYVDGLGMLPGTNHAHLNLGYRAVKWGGEEPEPEPEPGDYRSVKDVVLDLELAQSELLNQIDNLSVDAQAVSDLMAELKGRVYQ